MSGGRRIEGNSIYTRGNGSGTARRGDNLDRGVRCDGTGAEEKEEVVVKVVVEGGGGGGKAHQSLVLGEEHSNAGVDLANGERHQHDMRLRAGL